MTNEGIPMTKEARTPKSPFAPATADGSPSPPLEERVRERRPLFRFIGSLHDQVLARCGHEPSKGSPSPLNGERAGVRGETVREAYSRFVALRASFVIRASSFVIPYYGSHFH